MDEWQLKAKIVEWLTLREEVSNLEKANPPSVVSKTKHVDVVKHLQSRPKATAAPQAQAPMHEDIVAGVKTPFLLHEHSGPVPHDHPHRELAAKFVADVWKKNKYEGMRMSKKYLGIGEGGKVDPGMGPTYGKMDTKKSMSVDPAGISDPMQHNRLDSNEPKISNSPNKINPFRNIMKSLQKRSQR
jgi:hypothetical protein